MATISELRGQIQSGRESAQEAKRKLDETEKSLPDTTSQRALRNRQAGLQGRVRRQQVDAAKEEIGQRKGEIEAYEVSLSEQEVFVNQAEQEQQAEQQKLDKVYRQIQREAEGKKGTILDTQEERDLFNQIVSSDSSIRAAISRGTDAKVAAMEAGFDSVAKFQENLQIGKQLGLDYLSTQTGQKIALSQKGIEKLQTEIRSLDIKDIKSFEKVYPQFRLEGVDRTEKAKMESQKQQFLDTLPEKKSLVSGDFALNMTNASVINGTSISDRLPSRVSMGDFSKLQPSNLSTSWIANLTEGIKAGTKKAYSPELGAFIEASPTGRSATGFITPINPSNPLEANLPSYVTRTKNIPSLYDPSNIINIPRAELSKRYLETQKIDTEISSLEKGNVDLKKNEWIGSQEDYNKYATAIAKRDRLNTKVKVGLLNPQERDIREFRYLAPKNFVSKVGGNIRLTSEISGATLGEAAASILPEKGFFTTTTRVTGNIALPYQSRGTSFNEGVGYFTPKTNIDVTKTTNYFTSSQGRAVGGFVGRTLPYLNPAGVAIGAAEVGGLFAGEIELTGSVKKGAIETVKRYPLEVATAAVFGGASAGLFAVRKLKLTKGSRFLDEAIGAGERRIENLKAQSIVNQFESQKIVKPRVSVFNEDTGLLYNKRASVTKKVKGTEERTEIYASDILKGTVKEKRWTGNLIFDRSGIRKKFETFKGIREEGKDFVKETIDFGDFTRVTEVKDGKGTTKLFEKGTNKELVSRNVRDLRSPLVLKEETKTAEFKADIQTSNPLTITESGGKRVVTTQSGDEIKFLGDKSFVKGQLDLTAQREVKDVLLESTTRKGKNIFELVERKSLSSDITTVGARKGKAEVVGDGFRMDTKVRRGQTIEFDEALSRDGDLVKTATRGESIASVRKISPNIGRRQLQSEDVRVIRITGGADVMQGLATKAVKKQKGTFDALESAMQKSSKESNVLKANIVKGKVVQKFNDLKLAAKTYVSAPVFKPRTAMQKFETPNLQFENTKSRGILLDTEVKTQTSQAVKLASATSQVKDTMKVSATSTGLLNRVVETLATRTKEAQATNLSSLSKAKLDTALASSLKTRSTSTQTPKRPTRTTTTTILKPKTTNIINRVERAVRERPEMFEAVGIRFGKEVAIAKGSKEKVAKELSGFLKGTLGASGFLKKSSGEKVLADDTRLLGDATFRKSKVNPFLVVEKREKRLKRGTKEVPEILTFKKKASKSKSLFGI